MDDCMTEVEFSELSGFPLGLVRKKRGGLVPGADYRHEDGRKNAVVLTLDGARKVAEALGVELAEVEAQRAKKTGGAGGPIAAVATVAKVTRNPRILMATVDGREVRVRVRKSLNFVPGMPMDVIYEKNDLWAYVGRLPRWRGRY